MLKYRQHFLLLLVLCCAPVSVLADGKRFDLPAPLQEKVDQAIDREVIEGKKWYHWAARVLVDAQKENGSWKDAFGGYVDTSFTLLVLKRANFFKDLTATIGKPVTLIEKAEKIDRPVQPSPLGRATESPAKRPGLEIEKPLPSVKPPPEMRVEPANKPTPIRPVGPPSVEQPIEVEAAKQPTRPPVGETDEAETVPQEQEGRGVLAGDGWLLLAGIALLVLGALAALIFSLRRDRAAGSVRPARAPRRPSGAAKPAAPGRCARCGAEIKASRGEASARIRCPRCGTVQPSHA